MFKHYKQKIVLLIDNYDYPLRCALNNSLVIDRNIFEVMEELIPHSLLYNENVTKIIGVGVYTFENKA
jgi:hypothetical protein